MNSVKEELQLRKYDVMPIFTLTVPVKVYCVGTGEKSAEGRRIVEVTDVVVMATVFDLLQQVATGRGGTIDCEREKSTWF